MPDIDFGQLSEALNDKMDRDAHNVQSPSAVVIAKQDPTSDNNYTWYRLYSDGWVEQGGYIQMLDSGNTINFPIAMADTNYNFYVYQEKTGDGINVPGLDTNGKTVTQIKINPSSNNNGSWRVEGIAA